MNMISQKGPSSSSSLTQLNMAPPPIPTLDNWTISKSGEATGRVSNHPSPNIVDGEMVTTSRLRNVNRIQAREGSTVTTASGSKYKLGKPKNASGVGSGIGINLFGSGSKNLEASTGSSSRSDSTSNRPTPSPVRSKPTGWGFTSGGSSSSSRSNSLQGDNTPKLEGPLVEDWFISFRGELIGTITGHPDKNIIDGDTVTTSKITNDRNKLTDGDVVVTVNGSKYVLGRKRRGLPTAMFNRQGQDEEADSGTFNSRRRIGAICK